MQYNRGADIFCTAKMGTSLKCSVSKSRSVPFFTFTLRIARVFLFVVELTDKLWHLPKALANALWSWKFILACWDLL